MKMTRDQLDTFSRLVVVEILDVGLRESTFREMFPREYDELCSYRSDMEESVRKVLRRVTL